MDEAVNLCTICGIACDGDVCMKPRCVAAFYEIKPPPPPKRKRVTKKLSRPIPPAKRRRKSRVDDAPRTNHREIEQHARDEDGQRITVLRYLPRHRDGHRAGVEDLLRLKEQLEK